MNFNIISTIIYIINHMLNIIFESTLIDLKFKNISLERITFIFNGLDYQ